MLESVPQSMINDRGQARVAGDSLFIVGTGIIGLVFKDVVWAGIQAAVGKDHCANVVVVDGGERREGVLVGEGGI